MAPRGLLRMHPLTWERIKCLLLWSCPGVYRERWVAWVLGTRRDCFSKEDPVRSQPWKRHCLNIACFWLRDLPKGGGLILYKWTSTSERLLHHPPYPLLMNVEGWRCCKWAVLAGFPEAVLVCFSQWASLDLDTCPSPWGENLQVLFISYRS